MAGVLEKITKLGDNFMKRIPEDKKERNRFYILLFSLIFLVDYLIFSVHVDKNVLDIFPTIPVFEERIEAEVFLPSLDAKTIIKEKRSIPCFSEDERLVKYIFNTIASGSHFENTSMLVPVELLVRKVWFIYEKGSNEKICAIDVEPDFIRMDVGVIPGSEVRFREAVEMTVKKIIPGVREVVIMKKGLPDKKLWQDI